MQFQGPKQARLSTEPLQCPRNVNPPHKNHKAPRHIINSVINSYSIPYPLPLLHSPCFFCALTPFLFFLLLIFTLNFAPSLILCPVFYIPFLPPSLFLYSVFLIDPISYQRCFECRIGTPKTVQIKRAEKYTYLEYKILYILNSFIIIYSSHIKNHNGITLL